MANKFQEELQRRQTTDQTAQENPFANELQRRQQQEPQQPGGGDDGFQRLRGLFSAGLQGINAGLADIVGAPTDVLEYGAAQIGLGSDRPAAGGSQFLRNRMADVGMTYRDIEEVPEYARPMARGGEAVGASVPFAAMPLARAARLGTRSAQGLFAPIIESARRSPGMFAAGEAASAGGAGAGAAVAEAAAPGNQTARMYGEIAGGMAPSAAVVPLAKSITGGLRQTLDAFSGTARKRTAAKRVQDIVSEGAKEGGDDVDTLAMRLREPSESGADVTSAQKTGSQSLSALERTLVKQSREMGGRVESQTKQAVSDLRQALNRAAQSGDPEALRQAAQARRRWFEGLLDQRLNQAEKRIQRAADDIRPNDPETRRSANLEARDILTSALKDARDTERSFWQQIPQDAPVNPEEGVDAFQRMKSELLEEEAFEQPVESAMRRFERAVEGQTNKTITSGEVQRLRSQLLEKARSAFAQKDFGTARRLETIADGLLQDLDQVPGAVAEQARAFSRSLNDKFRRTFASTVLGRNTEGGQQVAPELTLERTMAGGGPQAASRAEGLRQAVEPIEGMTTGAGRPEAMRQQQGLVLRDIAARLVDPDTGKVTPRRLKNWRSDNRDLLRAVPDLDDALKNVESANRALDDLRPRIEQARKIARDRAAFSKLARTENPQREFERAIRSERPTQELSNLFKLAKRGGEEAKAGARRAYIDALWSQATDKTGLPSPEVLDGLLLNGPIRQAARRSGAFSEDHLRNIGKLRDEIARARQAMESGQSLDEVLDPESAAADLVARIAGANLGGASAAGQAAGTPLVLAQAGSERMRGLLNRLPRQKVVDILNEAVQSPEMMADLLETPTTSAGRRRVDRSLAEIMYRAGIERPAVAARLMEEEE